MLETRRVEVFDRLVKPDDYVRRALQSMDFERFRPILASYYRPDEGPPSGPGRRCVVVRRVTAEWIPGSAALPNRRPVV